jgi:excisionase family DNA binding protein
MKRKKIRTKKKTRRKMSNDKLLTVKEVANFLCVHPQTIYQLIYHRKIPFIRKKGVGYRFSPKEIRNWLERDKHSVEELRRGVFDR